MKTNDWLVSDYTYLYRFIYLALINMTPEIVGEHAQHISSKRFVREFKEAKELARRISEGECPCFYEQEMITRLMNIISKSSTRWWN